MVWVGDGLELAFVAGEMGLLEELVNVGHGRMFGVFGRSRGERVAKAGSSCLSVGGTSALRPTLDGAINTDASPHLLHRVADSLTFSSCRIHNRLLSC